MVTEVLSLLVIDVTKLVNISLQGNHKIFVSEDAFWGSFLGKTVGSIYNDIHSHKVNGITTGVFYHTFKSFCRNAYAFLNIPFRKLKRAVIQYYTMRLKSYLCISRPKFSQQKQKTGKNQLTDFITNKKSEIEKKYQENKNRDRNQKKTAKELEEKKHRVRNHGFSNKHLLGGSRGSRHGLSFQSLVKTHPLIKISNSP